MATADSDTWAGMIIAGPYSSDGRGPEHRTEIEGYGFTVVADDRMAGQTRMFVYGNRAAVQEMTDYDVRRRLPGYFWKVASGTTVDEHYIRSWPISGLQVFPGL